MSGSKKMAKGIGIGMGVLIVVVVITLVFTNVDDVLSEELAEVINKVKLTNPIQSYEINSECDYVNFLLIVENQGKFLRFLQDNQENILQKTLEKTKSMQQDEFIKTSMEITMPMIMNEFSINPKLTSFVGGMFSGKFNDLDLISYTKLPNSNCEIYESTAKSNKEFMTRGQTQSSSINSENTGALGSEHLHAGILVKIFGDTFDFAAPAYQIKSSSIHFEGRDGSTVHKHTTGVTLGYLFDTLQLTLDDQCFVFQDGRSFCTNDDYSLKFYINGEKVNDIRDYSFADGDRILISYGEGSPGEIKKHLEELESQQIIQ